MSTSAAGTELCWLPMQSEWSAALRRLRSVPGTSGAWPELRRLAGHRMTPVELTRLNRELLRQAEAAGIPQSLERVRLALLGSSTTHHLLAGLRAAGLRRGLWIELFEGGYGQYLQQALEPSAALRSFAPEMVVFALDAIHLLQLTEDGTRPALQQLQRCWHSMQTTFGATVVQQTGLPRFEDLLGNNEFRLPDSPQTRLAALNAELRPVAAAKGVPLLAVDRYVNWGGIDAWHDPALWHLAKQEVHPSAAALWGDLLARVIAAARGRSKKCLVLDLDNTLWGGVLGDEGAAALRIGQGSAVAEAHFALQEFCLRLRERGVLLAVCSKNDEEIARAAFQSGGEMPLKLSDFACFVANWRDKASNLREIASQLNLGLDALVFLDDNPAERALIRQELPEVAVPELDEDPANFVRSLTRAGYFEALAITEEDRLRAGQYGSDRTRLPPTASVTDVRGHLRGLAMRVTFSSFDEDSLERIVQLANKTNQFNLTTLRLGPERVRQWIAAPEMLTWKARLTDRFGDHGIITLLAGELRVDGTFELLLWLMSCRVFGREVEHACLNVVVEELALRGVSRLIAPYRPTAKNGLLTERLVALGFMLQGEDGAETQHWELRIATYVPAVHSITLEPPAPLRKAGAIAVTADVL